MTEIWKDIPDYEGMYQVSNLGNVRSLNWRKRKEIRNLYLKPHNKGYRQVELAKNGQRKMFLVHRLVASAFLPNPFNLPVINHKDENKSNNNVDNLEWCTFIYNVEYSYVSRARKNCGYSITRRRPFKLDVPVRQISIDDCREICVHNSLYELCKEKNWRTSSIKECCEGKRKTAYGFIWSYAN